MISVLKGILKKNKSVVGIEAFTEGLSIAVGAKGNDRIHSVDLINAKDFPSRLAELKDFVQKKNLDGATCHFVLFPEDYQLLLVEAPKVPVDEMREAIRWRIKDLINIPVDDAVVDIFFLPEDAMKAGKQMLYVVVASKSTIQQSVDLVLQSNLKLADINIADLALRNISFLTPEGKIDARGVVIVRIVGGAGYVSIYRRGNMYLSRQFQTSYKGGLFDELPSDSIMLEIQRSLDYYERQMGQAPPEALYFCGENISEDKLSDDLKRGLTVPVKAFHIDDNMIDSDCDEMLAQMCIGAMGGLITENNLANQLAEN